MRRYRVKCLPSERDPEEEKEEKSIDFNYETLLTMSILTLIKNILTIF